MNDRELMQQALDALEAMQSYARAELKGLRICDEAIEDLRARLAHPEPEPVAWWDGVGRFATAKEKNWDRRTGGILSIGRDIPLYTAPPQREWQGLTDEEFEQVVDGLEDLEDCWTAIEAKLKEKNA